MVVSDLAQLKSIEPIIIVLLSVMREPFKIDDEHVNVTFSIGISFYPKNSSNVDDLIHYADLAMYEAKTLGGNQFQFY